MLFLLYASEASSLVDTTTRMGLPQFKALLQAAKVTNSSVPPEKVDELYMALQASPGATARCVHCVQQLRWCRQIASRGFTWVLWRDVLWRLCC